MTFGNPDALWLLLALPPLVVGLYLWGWKTRKEAAGLFPTSLRRLKREHLKKYADAIVFVVPLILASALPQISYSLPMTQMKAGEIALLVDVSTSMAAQKDLDSPNRLERVKPVLYEIIDSMAELQQVKISLYGFTTIARSQVPLVSIVDYNYLKESIDNVLTINSVPSRGTSLGYSVQSVAGKFSQGDQVKIIILFSDGEPYYYLRQGMTYHEETNIERGVETAFEEGVIVITVGFGEMEGAKVPIYDSDGEFTGEYSQLQGVDYVSFLEEDGLEEIASGTDGKYFTEDDLSGLIDYIKDNLDPVDSGQASKETKVNRSIARWFLLAALPAWLILARRYILG